MAKQQDPKKIDVPVLFEEGNMEEKLAAIIDASEHQQSKEKAKKPGEIKRSLHLFSLAVELSLDGVIIGNLDGFITYVNNAILKMYGSQDKDELVGHHILEFIAEKDRARIISDWLFSSRTGEGKTGEYSALIKMGEIPVEVTNSVLTDKSGKQIGFIDIVRNISERKKTEEALRQSEKKYRLLFENMQNGFFYCQMVFDNRGKPISLANVEFNETFEKITELEESDFIGEKGKQTMRYLVEKYFDLFRLAGRISLTGESQKVEVELKKTGCWYSIFIFSPQKGHLGLVFEDITEQKKLYQKIEEYSEGLEYTVNERTKALVEAHEQLLVKERFAAIGELAGMIGHDLRNPLTGIKNAVYLLKKNPTGSMDDRSLELLTIIDRSVESSNKIINDLLDYSRELHLEFEEYSPKSLINYVLLSSVKVPSNIILYENVQSFPMVWVDVGKMERVFLNLIGNAIEAMPNGGKLDITSVQNGNFVEISFTDTGIGMSEELQLKIFKPLFTTKAKGMGFGLAICRRIIEAHGGKITVKSIPNKGSTFTVSLPTEQRQN